MSRFALVTLIAVASASLAGCGESDPETARKNLHLPPEGYVADGTRGEAAFSKWCVNCHGPAGSGSGIGPPLVDSTYRPGHHPDMAFHMAVKNGVKQHHWQFGHMPPMPQVSPEATADIAAYIRALQRRAGID